MPKKKGRKKDSLNRLLNLLYEKSLRQGEIRAALKIDRKTEYRIIREASERGWIEEDSMGRYHLSLLGKSNIRTAKEPLESLSLKVQSQIIDLLSLRSVRPTAKCIIEIEDADKIEIRFTD